MSLRLLRPALLTTVLLTLAVPQPAWAADAVLLEPADGVVTGASRLVVRVATTAQDRAGHIDATLRHVDGDLSPDARHPLCDDAATCSRERADYTVDFDPRTGAPFLPPGEARILPNGDYLLRVVVSRDDASAVETLDLPMTVSAPGTAPSDVEAAADGDEVELRWQSAPEPDIAGYLVERATDTGWTSLAEVPAQAASFADVPGPGIHAYRVVTLRPDGRGATYETVSREVSVEVVASDDPTVAADGATDPRDGGDEASTSETATATSPPASEDPVADDTGSPAADPTASATPNPDAGTATASPDPGPSLTARTVTEDGELVVDESDPASAGRSGSRTRLVAVMAVGLVFLALTVRVWRASRPVHRRPV